MNYRKYIPVTTSELFTGSLVFIACLALVIGSRLSRLTNANAIRADRPVHIYLHERTNLATLSEMFADSGVVSSKEEIRWAGRLLGWNHFLAGHYLVDGGYSYDVFLSRMARGIQDPVELTILPGLRKGRLIEDISSTFQFDSLELANTLTDSIFLAKQELNEKTWMGRMLPDTYSMYWNTSPRTVIIRILRAFNSSVTERYRARFDSLEYSVDDIVTLASIIEWEVRHDEEKKTVSGLYWNRLERGMRLQADPTVNYAIGERRRLLYEDYEIDDPYNTYQHDGLPPGPITNPSLSSIEAALFPEDHDYLYMVANPKNGYHVFSKTFEEHKKHSAQWREWLRKQYRIKRQREQQQSDDVSS